MAQEIERKFLVRELPWELLQGIDPLVIRQGYLIAEPERELRLREAGRDFTLTKKFGQGLVREEQEERISQTLFDFLWPLTQAYRLEKHRYCFELAGHACELDIYQGSLSGLCVMEVEFATEAEAEIYTPPGFASRELTGESAYKNLNLAGWGAKDGSWSPSSP